MEGAEDDDDDDQDDDGVEEKKYRRSNTSERDRDKDINKILSKLSHVIRASDNKAQAIQLRDMGIP